LKDANQYGGSPAKSIFSRLQSRPYFTAKMKDKEKDAVMQAYSGIMKIKYSCGDNYHLRWALIYRGQSLMVY